MAEGRIYVTGSPRAVGNNQYDVDVRFDITFGSSYGYNNFGTADYAIGVHGQRVDGKTSFSCNSNQWVNIGGTRTFRITMPGSGKSLAIGLEAYINTKINPPNIGAKGSYALPARVWQWTVSYNANGGWGAPGTQTKNKGSTLKLSSTVPSRDGYTFKGWATSSTGGVVYQPGDDYTSDANVTLYAVWQIITYTVSYNANGGTGAPAAQTKVWGSTLTLSGTRPTRTNYNFMGWGTSSGSTTPSYQPGGAYTSNSGITLYAIWQLAYTAPRITNLIADRCNSAGVYTEEGTYAKVTFNWATDRTVSGIKIVCNGTTTNASGSNTSGSVSVVVGANALSTENSYTIGVSVSDSGGTTTQSTTVAPLAYIIDVKAGGKGVAFGAPAKYDNWVESYWPLAVYGNLWLSNTSKLQVGAGTGVNVYKTAEGGAVEFVSPNGSKWKIDSFNNSSLRVYSFASGNTPFYIYSDRTEMAGLKVNGNVIGQLKSSGSNSSWISVRNASMIRNDTNPGTGSFAGMISMKDTSGYWTIGTLGDKLYFSKSTDANYNAGNNTATSPYIDSSGRYRQPNGATYVNGTGGTYTGTFDFSELKTGGYYLTKTTTKNDRVSQLRFGAKADGKGYYMEVYTPGNGTKYWGTDLWASDISLKNSILPSTESALKKINRINFYEFYYNDSTKPTKIGFLSQQLEMVDEQLVFSVKGNEDNDTELLQPNESTLIPLITKGVRELNDKVVELENKVSSLENQIDELKQIIYELRGVKHGE